MAGELAQGYFLDSPNMSINVSDKVTDVVVKCTRTVNQQMVSKMG